MNDWKRIRAHYVRHLPKIMATSQDEWAIDAYAWCDDARPMIVFTPIENWLWYDIRANDAVLYPQFPVGRFVLDFANPRARVAVECDGAKWHTDKAKDAARDAELGALGWSVYRLPGWMCRQDFDEDNGQKSPAYERIKQICETHGISRSGGSGEWQHIGHLMPASFYVNQVIREIHGAA